MNHASARIRRLLLPPMLLALACAGMLPAAAAAVTNDTIADLTAVPVHAQVLGGSDGASVRLALRRNARVTVTVRRINGTIVRTLASSVRLAAGNHKWRWDGRNDAGTGLPSGRYRVRVTASNSLGKVAERRDFRKGLPRLFSANPGAIVVSLDPGHGAQYWGAFYQGYYEKHFNLDIAFRLRELLQMAGAKVVMSRTTDSVVNVSGADVNGDGKVTKADDLAARLDIANGARADVHLSLHNNSAGCKCVRGTEVFTSKRRTWTPEGTALATVVQAQQLLALEQFRSSTYWPVDRGVKSGSFYAMSPYSEDFLPRPSQMPTLLTESLFVNNDIELGLLKRASVRQALAVAFYIGIAEYLNSRDYGVGYEVVAQPTTAIRSGRSADYTIRVTNRGNRPSSGWVLDLNAVPAVPYYDGSGTPGHLLGSRPVPDGLAPGASVDVHVPASAPPTAGQWLVKAGVRIPGDDRPYLLDRGVPILQMPLTTR